MEKCPPTFCRHGCQLQRCVHIIKSFMLHKSVQPAGLVFLPVRTAVMERSYPSMDLHGCA